MATDYEKFYRDNPHGLGEPTREFVEYFNGRHSTALEILDVGCGQGRDALFIARQGHHVTAVDISPTGIGDLIAEATSERLNVTGIVADIRHYDWQGAFDVIVVDRTLHMLRPAERIDTLRRLLNVSTTGTHVLIADERANLPAFQAVFDDSPWHWEPILARRGFLFLARS